MAKKSVEEIFAILEAKNKDLEHQISRLQAINEIQNLMAKYHHFLTNGIGGRIGGLFAKKAPDISVEVANWGVWTGKNVPNMWSNHPPEGKPGEMVMHTLASPMIVVAGDGKTAKGLWLSPGYETHRIGGELKANWAWAKYAADFIKEDGEWKFWHVHCHGVFRSDYYKSWVDKAELYEYQPPKGADRPTRYYWVYSPTCKVENVPEPPEPYETWDGKTICGVRVKPD